jgi:hypothetical protein
VATQSKYEYLVIEDNCGGLHLFVFGAGGIDGGQAIYAATDYECRVGQLRKELDFLDAGESVGTRVDGVGRELGNPQAFYCEFMDHPEGWRIVAQSAGDERTVYPDAMGASAKTEFAFECLDCHPNKYLA